MPVHSRSNFNFATCQACQDGHFKKKLMAIGQNPIKIWQSDITVRGYHWELQVHHGHDTVTMLQYIVGGIPTLPRVTHVMAVLLKKS